MSLNLKYPCKIEYLPEDNGSYDYSISFFDFPEAISEGKDLEHAKEMAKSVLSVCLDAYLEQKKIIPEPSKIEGENIFIIEGELGTSKSYTKYHKKSYTKNKDNILNKKKNKEVELKKQGFKDLRELLHKDIIEKLNYIKKNTHLTRREILSEAINETYSKLINK